MADAAAAPESPAAAGAAGTLQVVPPDAEFQGPFTGPTKSNHTITNTTAVKLCVKIKVFDAVLVTSRPTCTFMTAGQQLPLIFQHGKFDYNSGDQATYSKRKVAVCYVEAPETASDAAAFAREVPAANWKLLKIQVLYKAASEAVASKSAGGGAAPAAASKSAAGAKATEGAPAAASKSAGGAAAPAAASKSAAGKTEAPAAAAKSAGGTAKKSVTGGTPAS